MKKAFTLIELLIVIAIIAILALIAIPNFIEAQTRSKIARVQADMRSIATGIEAYTVDNNMAPLSYRDMTQWIPANMGMNQNQGQYWVWSRLTTPMAYMSSVPKDPFTPGMDKNMKPKSLTADVFYMYYACRAINLADGSAETGSARECYRQGVTWFLTSYGPSRRQTPDVSIGADSLGCVAHIGTVAGTTRFPDLIYDPTNGTASFGYIFRTNLGDIRVTK